MARLRPWLELHPGDRVLDVGAAQGVTVAAFRRAGFDARGVEPFAPARETAGRLQELTGVPLDIRAGYAEDLPFDEGYFRYVHAISLLEHVDDPVGALREAYRVLEPGGGIYLKTGGVLNPFRQGEIDGFPLFPWYPRPLQRRIMYWARDHRPHLVGHTPRPAIHFFHHRELRGWFRDVGYRTVVDRWDMHSLSGEHSGLTRAMVHLSHKHRVMRFLGNVYTGGLEYLAIK
jgi:SAM-dependent methyltransferase